MRCEICGCEIRGKPRKAMVEGAVLLVCEECAMHSSQILPSSGRPKASRPPVSLPLPRERFPPRRRFRPVGGVNEEYTVVENYGQIIKRAREQRGWTQEDLAFKIGEKASFIGKLETEKVYPGFEVARKLEHVLGVKLIAKSSESLAEEALAKVKVSQPSTSLTLGDIAVFKEKKQ